jgi:hypothetical protein
MTIEILLKEAKAASHYLSGRNANQLFVHRTDRKEGLISWQWKETSSE